MTGSDSGERAVIANERAVRVGGLMRCCIQTVRENEVALTVVGDTINCPACKRPVIVAEDGIWEGVNSADD